jgi:small subunit ribosomal protein S8
MVNDTLSDFVTRVRNGYMAGRESILVPATKTVFSVAQVLVKTGYLQNVERSGETMLVRLKYAGKSPAMTGITRVSKPGGRRYSSIKKLPRVWGGLGINILSTPKGIMDGKQAIKLNTGGEVLAQVW